MVTKHCIILTWENTGWGRQAWCGCGRGTAGTARVGDGEPRAAPRPPTSEGVGGEVQRGADTVSRSSLSEEGTSCPSLRRSWCDAAEMRAGRPLIHSLSYASNDVPRLRSSAVAHFRWWPYRVRSDTLGACSLPRGLEQDRW